MCKEREAYLRDQAKFHSEPGGCHDRVQEITDRADDVLLIIKRLEGEADE